MNVCVFTQEQAETLKLYFVSLIELFQKCVFNKSNFNMRNDDKNLCDGVEN